MSSILRCARVAGSTLLPAPKRVIAPSAFGNLAPRWHPASQGRTRVQRGDAYVSIAAAALHQRSTGASRALHGAPVAPKAGTVAGLHHHHLLLAIAFIVTL